MIAEGVEDATRAVAQALGVNRAEARKQACISASQCISSVAAGVAVVPISEGLESDMALNREDRAVPVQ